MALTTPILYTPPAFDGNNPYTFTFNVIGGSQVVANQLTIIDQSTGTQIYQAKQTTFAFTHTVPAGTLTNGVYYQATLITYDAQNNPSSQSNAVQFYCYSTPTITFTNIPSSGIINNATWDFSFTYAQAEGELLNSYVVTLYDAQQIAIANSGTLYVGSTTTPPTDLNYQFAGLLDSTAYYIKVVGITVNNTNVETALTPFTVQYVKPNVFSIVQLTNNCNGGYINIKSNLANIEGTSNPSPPIYIDDDTAVDSRGDGYYVVWGNGYEINGDFTLSLWGQAFNDNTPIITMQSPTGSIVIRYCHGLDDDENPMDYADCTVTQGGSIYYIYSPYIIPATTSDNMQVWLRRINNVYELGLYNLS